MRLSTAEMEVGPLFANELFKANNIPTPSFSFGFTGMSDNEASFVDFGEPDANRVATGAISSRTAVTLDIYDDFFWSAGLQAIKFSTD